MKPSSFAMSVSAWLLLCVLLCQLSFGTTVVLLFRPQRIVAAADRKVLMFGPKGESLSKSTQKIYLIRNRFIIASLGINYLVYPKGQGRHLQNYSFTEVVRNVEKQISAQGTVSEVATVVKQTTTKELSHAILVKSVRNYIEKVASSDLFRNSNETPIRIIVAGFDHGIARAFEMNFRIDKKTNKATADVIDRTPPSRKGGLLATGFASAIEQIKIPESQSRKELDRLDPNAFKTLSGSGQEYSEEDQIRAMRALLRMQSEYEPCTTGKGANVVALPAFGAGRLLEYSETETSPDPDCGGPLIDTNRVGNQPSSDAR